MKQYNKKKVAPMTESMPVRLPIRIHEIRQQNKTKQRTKKEKK